MALNLDNTQYTSTLPTFKDGDQNSFTVTISGTIAASGSATWSGSKVFANASRMVRYGLMQSPVPAGAPTAYTSSDRLPLSVLVGGANFSAYLGCSVSGIPSITSIAPNIYITSTTTGASCTVSITNPNSAVMTMTTTVLTIYYTAFEIIGES